MPTAPRMDGIPKKQQIVQKKKNRGIPTQKSLANTEIVAENSTETSHQPTQSTKPNKPIAREKSCDMSHKQSNLPSTLDAPKKHWP